MELTRRSALKATAGGIAGASLAGCTGEAGPAGEEGRSGFTAFFALWDWAEHVGGESFSFENPVDVGELGHGWEPEGGLLREIAATDAFVYLDTPEFSWAQDVAAEFETNDDVFVIDAMAGLEGDLLAPQAGAATDRLPDRDHDWDPETVEIAEFDVIDRRTGESSALWHGDHFDGGVPPISPGSSLTLEAIFEDTDGRVLPLGGDEPFQFAARLADGADDEPIEIESLDDRVRLHGRAVGRTRIVFELLSDGEVLWDSGEDPLTARVETDVDADSGRFFDPHVWVDPVLSQRMVDNIADGLAEIDPDNADAYAANAESYNARLAEIDEALESMMAEADRDVGVIAGHNSFGYVENRYGFELVSPVGVSPEAEPSSSDIADTIEFVDDHGIDVVVYDRFESPTLAETIVDNSTADDIVAVSPIEGTTTEWNENGWGWVEQMEEINLPAFRRAVGAE